jgi:hypothetical protein
MKPVNFDGSNCTYAEDQEEYLSLPAYKHGDEYGTVTSCWQMGVRERLKVLLSGKVYLSLLTFNKPLTPQILDVNSPTDEARTMRKRYCWKCRWHQSSGGFGDEANIKESCNAIIGKHDDYATNGIIDRMKDDPGVLNANNDCAYYNWNWFGWRGY